MPLTDTAIRAAKPKETPYKVADGGGLFIVVNPTGSRLWRLKYRVAGREKVLSIGAYPAVSLAQARERREEAKALLARGGDPSQAKREAKRTTEAEARNVFRAVAADYLDKMRREGRAPATLKKTEWLISLVDHALGHRPIRSIKAPDILVALRAIEKRGRLETARRARSTIGTIFRYAIATARADDDPTLALRGALITPTVRHRAAILEAAPFGALLRAIDGFDGQPSTKAALQLMALLFPRPGELRMADWSEFDLEKRVWTIPPHRMKMRRPHAVPLPMCAVEILAELKEAGRGQGFVFPCMRSMTRPMSENTLNAALRRLGYSKEQATAHGFRATAATLLNESGKWNPDAIERQLAHEDSDDVRKAYARGKHWKERVELMDWWALKLEQLKRGGEIVPLFGQSAN